MYNIPNISGNNSTQAWVNLAKNSYSELETAGQIMRNEMNSPSPNFGNIIEQQQRTQKAARNYEMATNMLQTIHNMLKKVIEKLQVQ